MHLFICIECIYLLGLVKWHNMCCDVRFLKCNIMFLIMWKTAFEISSILAGKEEVCFPQYGLRHPELVLL